MIQTQCFGFIATIIKSTPSIVSHKRTTRSTREGKKRRTHDTGVPNLLPSTHMNFPDAIISFSAHNVAS